MLALWLRPKPDAKFRKHWNVYHHAVGYTTVVLIIVNVFEGLDLLRPGAKWTNAYVVVLTILGGSSFFLEIITWSVWLRQRAKKNAGNSFNRSRDTTAAAAAAAGNPYRGREKEKRPVDVI